MAVEVPAMSLLLLLATNPDSLMGAVVLNGVTEADSPEKARRTPSS